MRVSLLDRSRTRAGESDAEAVAATVARARRAEALGFQRFWTAEHHAVPGIASAAPAVLLAAIGARTQRIRLGTGGIMVPNHPPLVIAEQALLLESLYPGRIDIGLGGSLGFTAPIRRALGRTQLRDEQYAAEIESVRAYLDGRAEVTARPSVPPPPLFLLAIRNGLTLAAALGMPAVIAGPLVTDTAAVETYFRTYRGSEHAPEPYLMVGVEVAVADSEEQARDLLLPDSWAYADSRDVGEFRALRPVDEVRELLRTEASDRKLEVVRARTDSAIAGTPEQVAEALTQVVKRTGASEVLASVSTFERADVAHADEVLASLGGS
ncbi:MsnO8 family LLM class oxidoreductase [Millisia brevis]|uniref:MsnO8 family LLM class oxidoreductase n=1 Tax=Millisia brevis TaxID=264148 RepID=UPI000829EE38|nr:MsnO8 family LLM class oxidoreductase [Millisia brevis]